MSNKKWKRNLGLIMAAVMFLQSPAELVFAENTQNLVMTETESDEADQELSEETTALPSEEQPTDPETTTEKPEAGDEAETEEPEAGDEVEAEEPEAGDEAEAEKPEIGDDVEAEKSETEDTAETEEEIETVAAEGRNASRYQILSQKDYNVAPGIKENKYVMDSAAGNEQIKAYSITIDTKSGNAGLIAGYGNADASKWSLQPLTAQANAAERKRKLNIVGGINGDYFNMATGEPLGALVMNGVKYHADSNRPYFAIMKDGTAKVCSPGTPLTADVQEAIGGDAVLLKDGKKVPNGHGLYPNAAVGIKADGSLIIFAVDGRQAPDSVGIVHNDFADLLLDFGCVDALRLDGGGSMTFASQREGTEEVIVRNNPSDGVERSIGSSILVYSSAEGDGKFHHANIAPSEEIYTPDSSIQFKATGVDNGGYPAVVPAEAVWELAPESKEFGTIVADGTFESNGKVGNVAVNLKVAGEIVGTSTVEISAPDFISYKNTDISAAFDDDVNLHMIVKSAGRDVNFKDGDFKWTMSNANLGTMNGNVFHSSNGNREEGDLTATSVHNPEVSGTIHILVGKEPTIAWDFEDPEYFTIDKAGSNFYTANGGRGAKQSAELVTIDSGEPVRFGNRSLKINYDFTKPPSGTDGAYFGMNSDVDIPGTPTGIGVWVYAPEGTGNFWLRGYIKDNEGKTNPVDFTLQTSQATDEIPAGIYWEGWKYCEADLTGWNAPFKLAAGLTLRVMYVPGINMGTKTAGSLYFDNLQFVYGANDSDIDAPVIDTILANGQVMEDEMVFDTESINFEADFHDVENKYTTGIDYDTVKAYIDGNNVEESGIEYALDQGSNKLYLYNVSLTKGMHSLKVLIRDGFGNETISTKYFTVNNENAAETAVILSPESGTVPTLGKDYVLNLKANQTEDISEVSAQLLIDKVYEKICKVEFSDDYEGTTSYNAISRTLTINAKRKEGAAGTGSGNIARVIFPISADTKDGTVFNYTVKTGKYVSFASGMGSFSDSPKKLEVQAGLNLTADVMILGSEGTIYVTDQSGAPKAGAEVYNGKDLLGITDENGEITTDALCKKEGSYELFAKDADGNLSFKRTVICLKPAGTEDGKPYGILNSTVKDAASEKNITWMSNPLITVKAEVQYAEKSAYEASKEEAFATVEGNTSVEQFTAGNASAARVNSVYLTGLKPDTAYVYRVGDGKIWSDIAEFKTGISKNENTNFFIIADIQSEDLTNTQTILDTVSNGNYSFGIQTGDGVDTAINYKYWNEFTKLFGIEQMKGKDVIHVLGNHEYEGNLSGEIANKVYNLPGSKYYSVTYGNVYVAVLNYTRSSAELQEALEWLEKDAAASDARWKVLTMHQPSYYTNTTGGNGYIHDMVPKAAEKAGIDFVFSGHDHSYARTEPLVGGNIDENGVVYYICGSTGEKSYSVVNNPDFHFAKINDKYDAIYLSVEATKKSFTIKAMESDGRVIDTYTKFDPCAQGHTYEYEAGKLTCTICGESMDAVAEDYTGLVKDAQTGKRMYLKNGLPTTGVQEYAEKKYCFDENGLAYDGKFTYVGTDFTFKDGELVSSTDKGVSYIVGIGETADGLRWIIGNNFTLRIDGEGKMKNYSQTDKAPWTSRQAYVHTAYIGKDITAIGDYGMFTMNEMRELYFEKGIKLSSIGAHAFHFTKLVSVTLPETVTSIGNYAFADNRYLEEITIPANVTKLPYAAFQGCQRLAKAEVPENVTLIETDVFSKCPALTIYGAKDSVAHVYAEKNTIPFKAVSNAVYEGMITETLKWHYTDGTLTISGSGAMPDMSGTNAQPWYKMENGVKLQERITKVVIGKDVENIGAYAFINAKNLTEVVFEEGCKLVSVDKHAFQGSGLLRVELPSAVKELGNYAFAECKELKEISVSAGVKELPYAAFKGCEKLEKAVLPDAVTKFNAEVFAECDNLTIFCNENSAAEKYADERQIPVMPLDSTAQYGGKYGKGLRWEFEKGVLRITGKGTMPDYGVSDLKPWNKAGKKEIDLQKQIDTIFIGKDVENIGTYAFFDTVSAKKVVFEEGSSLKKIGKHGLQRLSVTELQLPETVKEIEKYAFAECNELKSVEIPGKVEFLSYALLQGCTSLEKVMIPENVTFIENDIVKDCPNVVFWGVQDGIADYYAAKWGIRFEADGKASYEGNLGFLGLGVHWKYYDGVMTFSGKGSIPDYKDFWSQPWYRMDNTVKLQNRIKKVVIGKDVKEIGAYALYDAVNLKEIEFEKGSSLKRIGKHAVRHTMISEISLPDSVTTIERYAFEDSRMLKEIKIPVAVKTVCYGTFMNCTSLGKAVVPKNVTFIEDKAFENCPGLTIFGAKDSAADSYAEKVKLPFTATEYETYTGNLGSGVSWEYSDGVLTIKGKGAMPDYKTYNLQPWHKTANGVKLLPKIETVIFEKGITRIGAYSFFGAENLQTVVFEDDSELLGVGKHAFQNTGLTVIELPQKVQNIESYAFAGCKNLEKADLPSSVVQLGVNVFEGSTGVTVY